MVGDRRLRLTRSDLEGIFGKGKFKEIKQFETLLAMGNDAVTVDPLTIDDGDYIYYDGAAEAWLATAPGALTKTDDTNVTLTLGGTPATALLEAVSLTVGWTGTLAVSRGGTGASTAGAALTNLGAVPATRVLTAGAGLTGGGDLSADRTFAVGAGTGITVNADDVAIDTTTEAERIRDVIGTALVAGTNITITVNDAGDTITIAATGLASTTQTGEQISGFIASPADKSYKIVVKMAHGGTITETTTISVSGTCTATFKINTTALGGTANSVSSSEQSQTHSGTNTFVAGDDIVLTVSSNAACADMSFTIKYTRTLA